jgi:hypothetical protein
MKTTIDIADDLLLRSKRLSREQHTTLRELVAEGLRHELEKRAGSRPFCAKPVTFGGEGLAPEFRDAPWSAFRDTAYKGRGA